MSSQPLKIRTNGHIKNAARERKDVPQTETGGVQTLCVDGKAHSFVQIKTARYNDNFIFKKRATQIKQFIDGTDYEVETNAPADFYTRLFCKKCTISTEVLVHTAMDITTS